MGMKVGAFGLVPLSRNETHEKIFEMFSKEKRGKVLDIPTGTGVLADRLHKLGFEVSCCDINLSFFAAKDLKILFGDMNKSLPYEVEYFDYIACLEGLEHTENPFNAIKEFSRVLKRKGRLFISIPNYLNIEKRMRFLVTGIFSKLNPRIRDRNALKGDVSMLHINQMGYPVLKFFLQWCGFRVIKLDMDRHKPRQKFFLPLVWLIRLYCFFWPKDVREAYLLDETLSGPILMGGNTLIIVAEKE